MRKIRLYMYFVRFHPRVNRHPEIDPAGSGFPEAGPDTGRLHAAALDHETPLERCGFMRDGDSLKRFMDTRQFGEARHGLSGPSSGRVGQKISANVEERLHPVRLTNREVRNLPDDRLTFME